MNALRKITMETASAALVNFLLTNRTAVDTKGQNGYNVRIWRSIRIYVKSANAENRRPWK